MHHMTVAERDQFEMITTDWSPLYHIAYDAQREHPFRAVHHDDRDQAGKHMQAETPAQLLDYIRADHAFRIAARDRIAERDRVAVQDQVAARDRSTRPAGGGRTNGDRQ